jgi:hypothetical protein
MFDRAMDILFRVAFYGLAFAFLIWFWYNVLVAVI